MSKKLLCFMLTLCMLMQAFGVVSFASDELLTDEIILENDAVAEEDLGIELTSTTEKFSKEYANDNFASGTDGWVVGTSVTDYEATISQVDAEGAIDGKALKITFPNAGSGSRSDTGRYGSVIKLLDDVADFSIEDTVTVKARVKADTAMRYQIKANRPNSLVQPDNDYTWPFYYGLLMHGDDNKLQVLGSGLYASEIGQTTYNYRANTEIATNNDTGLWTEYTIVFKPEEEKYYVTVVTTQANGSDTTVASNKTGYMLATKDELTNAYGVGYFDPDDGKYFLDLNSLTFTSRTAGNLYVDYVEVYGQRDYVNASASVNSTVSPTGSVVVSFAGENDAKVPAFPVGAVTIDGAECDVIPDVQAQTVTLKPKSKLTPGTELTVNVNSTLFDSAEGVNITGQTSFTVDVEYGSATAELISDSVIAANDSVTVQFTSTEPMTSFADGLVTIEGVECDYTSNANEKTVTLTPKAPLEAGATYTVKVDTELLKTSEGTILSGPSTFNFSVIPLSVFDVKLDKKPMPDETVSVTYVYSGVNKEGTHTYQWQTASSADAPDGEWTNLPNGTGKTYTFDYSLNHGDYVRVIMTPYDELGNQGYAVTTEPVMHKMAPSEDEDGVAYRKYYINDDFNTAGNVGNWKVGETEVVAGQTVTVTQENIEENGDNIGVMKLYAAKNKSEYVSKQQPYVDNDFADIQFKDDTKIVIETRIKDMGGLYGNTATEGAWSLLTFNRPNQLQYLVEASGDGAINFRGWNGGSLFLIKHDLTDNDPDKHVSGLRYKSSNYADSNLAEGNFIGKWVNVKIILDGNDGNLKDYTIIVTDDEGLSVTQTGGTLTEHSTAMYDVPSAVDNYNYTAKSMHTDIRNLSFVWRNFADTMYVDYFRLYELRPVETATAAMTSGSLIRPSDSVTVKFTGSNAIHNFAEGLVTIDGVETVMYQDLVNQTVTVTPVNNLTPGQAYTVRINKKLLASSEGFVLNGADTFNFNVGTVNVYDVITTGRTVPGTEMGIYYRYADSLADEGTHLYQWQKSTDGIIWEDIAGQTNDTYTVTQDIFDNKNYVRVLMTPCDVNGVSGAQIQAEMVIPETAPVLDSIKTNTTVIFPEMYLGPKYDYIDLNGDKIVAKDVQWYTADSAGGSWTAHSTDEYYYITENDLGKYFKYEIKITNDGPLLNETAFYESTVVGPVVKIDESTNLFINAGFERGDLVGWNNDDGIIELAGTEGARTGNYAVHLMPRESVNDNWPQTVNGLTAGKTYVLSGYVKNSSSDLPSVTQFWPYAWSGLSRVEGENFDYLVGNNWIQATSAFKATGTSASADFVSFNTMSADCYLDDLYFGELLIKDIETFTPDATEIPVEGTVKLSVTSGKIFNQVGTTHGLTLEKVKVRVPEGVSGITQEGNDLVIDNTAKAGTYICEIYCEPSYNSPAQDIFQKFVTVTLLANNDTSPKAHEVKVNGEFKTGKKLTGSYDFYQIEGRTDASTYSWMYSDTFDGDYTPIAGATGLTYTLESQYADKFIKFAVNPATADGLVGTQTLSDAVTMPRPPFVTDASVKGEGKVGGSVEAVYTYNDYNSYNNAEDEEGATTYQWYVGDYADNGFTPIFGATSKTYTFTENEIDKYVRVEIKPVSKIAPTDGTPVMSSAFFGPTAPVATNVAITKTGTTLTGSYNYSHTHGARETDSVYAWKVNGVLVSNSISYTIDFEGTKYVEFSVTPVGDTNPSTGKTYSYGVNMAGISSSGSTGAGGGGGGTGCGGGGGAAGSVGVTPIPNTPPLETEVKEPEQTQPKSDLSGHWGEVYVKEMETRGVMKADEKGNYDPDRTVSRSEMISYLFDALKLEEAEYNAEFSDVNALDSYAGKLQAMINNGTIALYHEFRPNDGISREEMCKILFVSLQNAGKLTKAETNVLDTFADKASISDWAIDYVNTIYSNKIMIGTSDTTFAPKENITRAQVATMLVRILKVIEG